MAACASITLTHNPDSVIRGSTIARRYTHFVMNTLFAQETKTDIASLRDALDGSDPDARKTAASRVVNLMRTGENVQALFTSMLRSVRTTDLEFKKLI
jgi:vesicle coat complex subunit